MPSDRIEVAVALLALAAAALVLVAPLVGRNGAPAVADGLMIAAASAGVASFALAGFATVRAARRPRRREEEDVR